MLLLTLAGMEWNTLSSYFSWFVPFHSDTVSCPKHQEPLFAISCWLKLIWKSGRQTKPNTVITGIYHQTYWVDMPVKYLMHAYQHLLEWNGTLGPVIFPGLFHFTVTPYPALNTKNLHLLSPPLSQSFTKRTGKWPKGVLGSWVH